MLMKCSAVCLVALSLLGSLCDAQWPHKPSNQKPKDPIKNPPQQAKQHFEKPLNWEYPVDPTPHPQPMVPFEPVLPVPAASVAVECREKDAVVEVKKDFFGIGQLINPADLTLGGCSAVLDDEANQLLIFATELSDCGSKLALTEDSLIYTFTLVYNPQPVSGSPVVRTSKAVVFAECHYQRKQDVSSLPLQPLWIPFSAVRVAEEFLYFTLKLLTDNLQSERPSNIYSLGDLINFEATVQQYFHVPLRVFVNSCVATVSPDVSSHPRYAFIENNGCLVDARITGSDSRFLDRTRDDKLLFQLEAFRFQNVESGVMYITCHLSATSADAEINQEQRACSYVHGSWIEASGVGGVCESCDSGSVSTGGTGRFTPGRKMRDVSQKSVASYKWEGDVTLGPIHIKERAQ